MNVVQSDHKLIDPAIDKVQIESFLNAFTTRQILLSFFYMRKEILNNFDQDRVEAYQKILNSPDGIDETKVGDQTLIQTLVTRGLATRIKNRVYKIGNESEINLGNSNQISVSIEYLSKFLSFNFSDWNDSLLKKELNKLKGVTCRQNGNIKHVYVNNYDDYATIAYDFDMHKALEILGCYDLLLFLAELDAHFLKKQIKLQKDEIEKLVSDILPFYENHKLKIKNVLKVAKSKKIKTYYPFLEKSISGLPIDFYDLNDPVASEKWQNKVQEILIILSEINEVEENFNIKLEKYFGSKADNYSSFLKNKSLINIISETFTKLVGDLEKIKAELKGIDDIDVKILYHEIQIILLKAKKQKKEASRDKKPE